MAQFYVVCWAALFVGPNRYTRALRGGRVETACTGMKRVKLKGCWWHMPKMFLFFSSTCGVHVCVCVCACVCVCLSVSVCFNKQGCMMKLKLIETSLMILVFEVTCQSYCSMCELFWFSFLFSLDPASRPTATEGWVLSFIYLVCQVIMEKLCRY